MNARDRREAWPVGSRVREIGPTITFVPVLSERPARTGTVVWSAAALCVVHWDGEARPDPAHPAHDALVVTGFLELASAAQSPEQLPLSPATAAPSRPALRLVSLGETDDLGAGPASPPHPALRLVSLGETDDLDALDPDPDPDPDHERTFE